MDTIDNNIWLCSAAINKAHTWKRAAVATASNWHSTTIFTYIYVRYSAVHAHLTHVRAWIFPIARCFFPVACLNYLICNCVRIWVFGKNNMEKKSRNEKKVYLPTIKTTTIHNKCIGAYIWMLHTLKRAHIYIWMWSNVVNIWANTWKKGKRIKTHHCPKKAVFLCNVLFFILFG